MFHVKHCPDMGLFWRPPGTWRVPRSRRSGGAGRGGTGGSLHRASALAGIAAGPVPKTGASARGRGRVARPSTLVNTVPIMTETPVERDAPKHLRILRNARLYMEACAAAADIPKYLTPALCRSPAPLRAMIRGKPGESGTRGSGPRNESATLHLTYPLEPPY